MLLADTSHLSNLRKHGQQMFWQISYPRGAEIAYQRCTCVSKPDLCPQSALRTRVRSVRGCDACHKADWPGVDALTATLAGLVRARLLSDRDVPEARTRLVTEQPAIRGRVTQASTWFAGTFEFRWAVDQHAKIERNLIPWSCVG